MTTVRRIHFDGATQLVRLAGAQGLPLFADEDDALAFEAQLARAARRFGARVYAACLLPQLVEMVVETGPAPLSRLMQQLTAGYTRYANARYGKTGHLFAGRYKTVLMDPAAYLPEAIRQVHLLPVHAGLVADPQQFLWSGHRALLGLGEKGWLDRPATLRLFHASEERAVTVYRVFVSRGATTGRRLIDSDAARDGILGSSGFRQSLEERQTGARPVASPVPLARIFALVAARAKMAPAALAAPGRDRARADWRHLAAWLALRAGAAGLTEIAAFTGRELSTLSRNLGRFEERLASDATLRQHAAALQRQIEESGHAPD